MDWVYINVVQGRFVDEVKLELACHMVAIHVHVATTLQI